MAEKIIGKSIFESMKAYNILPFKMSHHHHDKYLLSNDYGDWCILDRSDAYDLVLRKIQSHSKLYNMLKAKHFLYDDSCSVHFGLLASKYKTKKSFIDGFSKLHIFVLTIRCNHSCTYCQVSRKTENANIDTYDMSENVLIASIKLMLETPSKNVTMEFQGGESMLNMPLVRKAVLLSKELNSIVGKTIQYVICTNLSNITMDDLLFFKQHNVLISTSIDGPEFLHNKSRVCGKFNSYEHVTKNIITTRNFLGHGSVSALMTTTKDSLAYHKEIIDEYVSLGFESVFIRELNPYGFAVKSFKKIGYTTNEFIEFYKKCLTYIIDLNKSGIKFRENYASIILKKLMTPLSVGFVDLQSPCGTGFGVTLYNYNGDVYPSDESRMIAESGDEFFRLGNVLADDYDDIFFSEKMQLIASAAITDSLPQCSDCAYSPFCGAEPVRHYQTQKDVFGHRADDSFCTKNKEIIKTIIDIINSGSDEEKNILMGWVI